MHWVLLLPAFPLCYPAAHPPLCRRTQRALLQQFNTRLTPADLVCIAHCILLEWVSALERQHVAAATGSPPAAATSGKVRQPAAAAAPGLPGDGGGTAACLLPGAAEVLRAVQQHTSAYGSQLDMLSGLSVLQVMGAIRQLWIYQANLLSWMSLEALYSVVAVSRLRVCCFQMFLVVAFYRLMSKGQDMANFEVRLGAM